MQTVPGESPSSSRHERSLETSSALNDCLASTFAFGSLMLERGLRWMSSLSTASCMTCFNFVWIRRISPSLNLPLSRAVAYAREMSPGLKASMPISPKSSRICRTSHPSLSYANDDPKVPSLIRRNSSA